MGMMKTEHADFLAANDERSLMDKTFEDTMKALYNNFRPQESKEMQRLESQAVRLAEWRREQDV